MHTEYNPCVPSFSTVISPKNILGATLETCAKTDVHDDYHLPEDDNHHSHRRGNLKSYTDVHLRAKCPLLLSTFNQN
jgi:hypothetical protein